MTAEDCAYDDRAQTTDGDTGPSGVSRQRKVLIGALVVLIAGAGTLLLTFKPDGESSAFHQIEITTLQGDPLSFASFAGKPVMLNFFASWCGPCVSEMPVIEALSREFTDELTVIGLAFEDAKPALDIVASTGVTYLTGLDENGVLLERFDGFGMPTTVFIDSDGSVIDIHIGELSESAFRDKLLEHLGIGGV